MNNRIVPNESYLPVIRELLEAGKTVPLTISGNSMSPFFVHIRDRVLLAPAPARLKRGDMAIFQRRNGQYILHRICRTADNDKYYFIGDAQTEIEGPIDREQIFGKVVSVCRKGRWIGPGNFWWEFFEHVWLRIIPLRCTLRRLYGRLRP